MEIAQPPLIIGEGGQSERLEEPLSCDPMELKAVRTKAKSAHTKTANRLKNSVEMAYSPDIVKGARTELLVIYEQILRIQQQRRQVGNFSPEDLAKEESWMTEINAMHFNVIAEVKEYLRIHDDRPLSRVSSSCRTSSTLSKLREAERLLKEKELQIKQAQEEAAIQLEEENALLQIEAAKSLERKRIDTERNMRRLTSEREVQRLGASILRQQLDEGRTTPLPPPNLAVDGATGPANFVDATPFGQLQPVPRNLNAERSSASESGLNIIRRSFQEARGLISSTLGSLGLTPLRRSQVPVQATPPSTDPPLDVFGARGGSAPHNRSNPSSAPLDLPSVVFGARGGSAAVLAAASLLPGLPLDAYGAHGGSDPAADPSALTNPPAVFGAPGGPTAPSPLQPGPPVDAFGAHGGSDPSADPSTLTRQPAAFGAPGISSAGLPGLPGLPGPPAGPFQPSLPLDVFGARGGLDPATDPSSLTTQPDAFGAPGGSAAGPPAGPLHPSLPLDACGAYGGSDPSDPSSLPGILAISSNSYVPFTNSSAIFSHPGQPLVVFGAHGGSGSNPLALLPSGISSDGNQVMNPRPGHYLPAGPGYIPTDPVSHGPASVAYGAQGLPCTASHPSSTGARNRTSSALPVSAVTYATSTHQAHTRPSATTSTSSLPPHSRPSGADTGFFGPWAPAHSAIGVQHGPAGPVATTSVGQSRYHYLPHVASGALHEYGSPLHQHNMQPHIEVLPSTLDPSSAEWFPPPTGQPPQTSHHSTPFSPDAWIFAALPNERKCSSTRPPKAKLPYFDGHPRSWPTFIQSFKVQVHDACQDDSQRIIHLRSCLVDWVVDIVDNFLHDPKLYHLALKELQRKFGSRRIVRAACSAALNELKPFRDNDFQALQSFSSSLHSIMATLCLGGYEGEVQCNQNLSNLEAKLPPVLRNKWGEVSYAIEQDHLPNLMDFDSWLDTVTMAQYSVNGGFLLRSANPQPRSHPPPPTHPKVKKMPSPQVFSTSLPATCPCCDGSHALSSCKKFKSLAVEKRAELLKDKKRCYRCLDHCHLAADCPRTEKCGKDGCKSPHHPLMHGAPRMYPKRGAEEERKVRFKIPESSPFAGTAVVAAGHRVTLMPIVPVTLSANGLSIKTLALLDTGAEISMIRQDIAKRLRLKGPVEISKISTFHGLDPSLETQKVNFMASSLDMTHVSGIEGAHVVKDLNLVKRSINLKKLIGEWPHLSGIHIPHSDVSDVTVLIGMDQPENHEIFDTRKDPMRRRAPRAIRTAFGWSIVGPTDARDPAIPQCHLVSLTAPQSPEDRLALMVDNFFNADTFGLNPLAPLPIGPEDKKAIQILNDTTRFVNGRYEAGLLWRTDDPDLPNNRSVAVRRHSYLERRLIADPVLAGKYSAVINEYLSLNHAHKLTAAEIRESPSGRTWYLPHHNVVNPNKPEKCRVVFDASASFRGVSLNSKLLKGPDFLTSLVGVLLRFRQYQVGLSADIVKMFHQVRVRPSDGPAFRFIWRPPGSSEPPSDYQMDVQVFGAISSPSICGHVLRQAAEDSETNPVAARQQIVDHFYVDNWLVSFPTVEEAVYHAHLMTEALQRGGFQLAQWGSSSKAVLSSLPGQPIDSINLDLDCLPMERTLGLVLDYNTDAFLLKVLASTTGRTKREILRTTASIFDPLGFLAPVLLTAKVILQDVCRRSVEWDDILDDETTTRWTEWTRGLADLEHLSIKRCLTPPGILTDDIDLHVFADASEIGYGAVAYLRYAVSDAIHCVFIMAKSRVAPLKYVSIPRLELLAAVMGIRLASTIKQELRIPIKRTVYWSDSTTVIRWINSTSCRFHIFVGNRVGEILESSDPADWRYVPTTENPADDCSRGLLPSVLTGEHRFFTGPDYLQVDPSDWPCFPGPIPLDANASDPEVRSTNWIGVARSEWRPIDQLIRNTSRLNHLSRVVAYVIRWTHNARVAKLSRCRGDLTADEIQTGMWTLIRLAQEGAYPTDLDDLKNGRQICPGSSLVKLTPFLDHRGLLSVGGRIGNAPLPFGARHPIILPTSSQIAELIIRDVHVQHSHSSSERTLHELRSLYWIPRGRVAVKRVLNRCFPCKRRSAQPAPPFMASLPSFRLQHHLPAFTHTGVDYFGPISVTIFRRKVKRWGCIFTCLSSRAVHLEMAYALDTDAFINAMFRFEHRRGTPAAYHSDNGTNFVGADRELAECLKRMDQSKIAARLGNRGTKWIFNPPASPHFGGVWERLIRTAKVALNVVLRDQSLTDEILSTALISVENLLNGRPLTLVSVDPAEPEALTPNHLLLGRANPNIAPDVFGMQDNNPRKRWRFVQSLTDQFWRRWMREYVPRLMERSKWTQQRRNLQVGDIVLILDPATPRGNWPLGRIIDVKMGPDQIVRSATVRTQSTELQRPAVKLCLLELDHEEADADAASCRAGDVANGVVESAKASHSGSPDRADLSATAKKPTSQV